MKTTLSLEILRHVFTNFGIINNEKTGIVKINSPEFMLNDKIVFESDTGDIKNNIYGCRIQITDQSTINVLIADCGQTEQLSEYAMLIRLDGAPAYGCYLISEGDDIDPESIICLNIDDKGWMPCSTYLACTFAAGMEQVKELNAAAIKIIDYTKDFEALKSFIEFHERYFEVVS